MIWNNLSRIIRNLQQVPVNIRRLKNQSSSWMLYWSQNWHEIPSLTYRLVNDHVPETRCNSFFQLKDMFRTLSRVRDMSLTHIWTRTSECHEFGFLYRVRERMRFLFFVFRVLHAIIDQCFQKRKRRTWAREDIRLSIPNTMERCYSYGRTPWSRTLCDVKRCV